MHFTILFALILSAITLDWWLGRRIRMHLEKKRVTREPSSQDIYLFGRQTLLLSWLNRQRLRLPGFPAAAPLDIPSPRIGWKTILLEWSLITVAVTLFCAGILDLGQPTQLPGNESGVFQSLDWTFYNSIRINHTFPLWNPFLETGLPYVADPMLHVYNPLVSIPVLLFGVQAGFKLAIFFSFLLAAIGMWVLGASLGTGSATRLWMTLIYAFAGQPVARFFQGQYLFVLGFAWIPWAIASLFLVAKTRRRLYLATAIFSLALLFFCGNVYYPFFMLLVGIIFSLVMLFELRSSKPRLSLDKCLLKNLAIIGILALGLIAIQLLPLAEFWSRLSKSTQIAGMHTPFQVFLDYTSRDTFRPDAYAALPAREEFYAYIGLAPFLALGLLPLAIWKRHRKPILFFVLVLGLVILWIDLDRMPWHAAFINTKFLLQFRHLLRSLLFGSFAIIILAGLGLDTAWKVLIETIRSKHTSLAQKLKRYAAYSELAALGVLMVAGILDLYHTNRQYVGTVPMDQRPYTVLHWLRNYDLSDYYVRFNPDNAYEDAPVSVGLRFIDAWYHFADIRSLKYTLNSRLVQARPNYQVVPNGSLPPDSSASTIVQELAGYNVYRMPGSLPYAFTVKNQTLAANASESGDVRPEEVNPLASLSASPNTIEMIANGGGEETLVVLITKYPGWRVRVDDRPAILENVSGYLAVKALPGVHKYVFSFQPSTFYAGLLLSLICLGITFYLLATDLRVDWRGAYNGLMSAPAILREMKFRAAQKLKTQAGFTTAVYRNGTLHPLQPFELAENTEVGIAVESILSQAIPPGVAMRRWLWVTAEMVGSLARTIRFETALFLVGVGIYLFTRFWALTSFPIYFFSDEAVQTLFAQDLITRGFRGPTGTPLPIYIEAAGQRWTPLLSMYFHALTMTLFGKSILVTRGTSAAISLLAVLSVALILKQVFKLRFWWIGAFLVALTPAWFLHSRTAFETVFMTAFYGCFLFFYLLYRVKSPKYLYPAILFAAMTFYTYSNAQLVIAAAAGLLFISDFRYHISQRKTLLRGALLILLFAIPLILFRLSRPSAITEHLRMINTYWMQPIPLGDKIALYLGKYAYGLSPQYWFFPNQQDLVRHRMADMGQIPMLYLPFFASGLLICLIRLRSSPHRAVIAAALAAPAGAALVDIGIARVLAFIIPANILATLGIDWMLVRLKRWLPYKVLSILILIILSWANIALLNTALTQGPLWFRDYGLYGMQYGARQLFEDIIPSYLSREPNTNILVSSSWANGTDNFLRFFLTPEQQKRVRMDDIEAYLFKKLPLSQNDLFVMPASEYQKAIDSPIFTNISVDRIVPYPDGTPGFYLARMEYSPAADEIFSTQKEARQQLVEGQVVIGSQTVRIRYSQIDIGAPNLMFDGDNFTLMRGLEANPFIIELYFPQPRSITDLTASFGLMNIDLTARLYAGSGSQPMVYISSYHKDSGNPLAEMSFDRGPDQVSWLRLEFLNPDAEDNANIHIRELNLLP